MRCQIFVFASFWKCFAGNVFFFFTFYVQIWRFDFLRIYLYQFFPPKSLESVSVLSKKTTTLVSFHVILFWKARTPTSRPADEPLFVLAIKLPGHFLRQCYCQRPPKGTLRDWPCPTTGAVYDGCIIVRRHLRSVSIWLCCKRLEKNRLDAAIPFGWEFCWLPDLLSEQLKAQILLKSQFWTNNLELFTQVRYQ